MKVTWISQAGLLFENEDIKIIVDPYLSDSVVKINPKNHRRTPVDERFLGIKPDVIICTHNHLDHVDPETLCHYLSEDSGITVLAPQAAWDEVRKFGGNNNYVKFNRHTSWTQNGVKFTAVKAEHSDIHPIGVIIDDGEKKYYTTGDTLYNEDIFEDIPNDIDVLFLPVNGVGNNMNFADAQRFAARVNAKKTVPLHFGLFDNIDPTGFICENRVIPELFKEIRL